MTPDSGRSWRARRSGPADAHGLAILLAATLLGLGTALPQLGTGGAGFAPPAPRMVERSAPEAPVPRRAAGREDGGPRLPAALNINTANAEALQALPGIGPGLAERIVADRQARGLFRTREDLRRVPGIGPKRWERIRPLIRLTEES